MLTPDELLARLATLIPPPRSHSLRYHGVFAPNSKDGGRVVPRPPPRATEEAKAEHALEPPEPPRSPAGAFQLEPPEPSPGRDTPRTRVPLADLLRKVFAVEVLECPRCAGRLEIIAFIAEASVARRILDHLGLASQPPPLARARGPDDMASCDPGPDDSAGDPIFE